jgi:hypothetical protein
VVQLAFYVGNFKFTDTIKIYLKTSENKNADQVFIYRISTTGKIYQIRENNGVLSINDNYCTKLVIASEKDFTGLDEITLLIGKKKYDISNSEIVKWIKIEDFKEHKIAYEIPITYNNGNLSIIGKFSNIINWKGDFIIFKETFPLDYFAFVILFSAFYFIYKKRKSFIANKLNNIDNMSFIYLTIFIIVCLVAIIGLIVKQNFWGAGKAFTYISPLFFLIIVLPVLESDKIILRKNYLNPVIIFCLIQMFFGIGRIFASTNINGIHCNYPYSGAENPPGQKIINRWDISALNKIIENYDVIRINVNNRWMENFLFVYLYERNKKFYTVNKVNNYFDMGENGYPEIPKSECVLEYKEPFFEIIKIDDKKAKIEKITDTLLLTDSSVSASLGDGWHTDETVLKYIDEYFNFNKIDNPALEIKKIRKDIRWTKYRDSSILITSNDDERIDLKLDYEIINDNSFEIFLNGKKIGDVTDKNGYELQNILITKGRNILLFRSNKDPIEWIKDWYPRKIGIGFKKIEIIKKY